MIKMHFTLTGFFEIDDNMTTGDDAHKMPIGHHRPRLQRFGEWHEWGPLVLSVKDVSAVLFFSQFKSGEGEMNFLTFIDLDQPMTNLTTVTSQLSFAGKNVTFTVTSCKYKINML